MTFRYTMDGTDPTVVSPAAFGNTIIVDHSTSLKVKGFRTGWSASDTKRGEYFINLGSVATSALNPTEGAYTAPQSVTVTSATPGATIRYTIDGTEPNINSPIYAGAIETYNTREIRAKAFKSDMTPSATASGLYVIDLGTVDTPRLSPGSGMYPTSQVVTVTAETAGATIHYTTNGNDPTEGDPTIPSGTR